MVDIHSGTNSVLTYLLKPVLKLRHEAFRERRDRLGGQPWLSTRRSTMAGMMLSSRLAKAKRR